MFVYLMHTYIHTHTHTHTHKGLNRDPAESGVAGKMSGDLSCTRDQVNGPSLWTKSTKQVSGPSQRKKSLVSCGYNRHRPARPATPPSLRRRGPLSLLEDCRQQKPQTSALAVRTPTQKESKEKPATRLMKNQLPCSFNRSQLVSGTTTVSLMPQPTQLAKRSHYNSMHAVSKPLQLEHQCGSSLLLWLRK